VISPRGRWVLALLTVAAVAVGIHLWSSQRTSGYFAGDLSAFAAGFPPPPAADSPQQRQEIEELLAIQRSRTPAQVAAARADRKTEISSFYGALGISAADRVKLPALEKVAEKVEDAIRRYVRAAKERFRRLRPYEVEPRIQPCIDDVRGDLSYPSGHAAYAYAMAYLLADMAPERAKQLDARAREFASQRMVCGVHFASDLVAGGIAAQALMREMRRGSEFQRDARAAAIELRAALSRAQRSGHSSASRAPPRLALEAALTRPRCSMATRATIASPRPKPPVSRLRLVSSRVKAWNTEARRSSGIPSPSSSTTMRHNPSSRASSMVTLRRA
jgi:acid phosphatase (class A)